MTRKHADTKQAASADETKPRVEICRDPHKVVPQSTNPEAPQAVQAVVDHREPGAIDAAKLPDVAPEDRVPPLPPQPVEVTPEK